MAALLERLVEAWPVDVRRIALVGHSMGGLISRAACAVATDADAPWTDRVTDVVLLGTPNLGAPLERVVNKGVAAIGRLPEAAPFGRILEYRSVGILDLRHGLARDVQNLPHARYRLVAATLTRSSRSLTSGTIGDLLVPYASALGRTRRGEEMFPGAETLHVPGADHFDLLNHDDIYAALRTWLQDRDATRRSEKRADPHEPSRYPAPISATVEMKADPEAVWQVVSDLRRMPEFSPELRKAFVLGKPGVGATIIGRQPPQAGGVADHLQGGAVGAGPGRGLEDARERGDLGLRARGHPRRHPGHRAPGAARSSPSAPPSSGPVIGGAEGHDRELAEGIATTLERIRSTVEA